MEALTQIVQQAAANGDILWLVVGLVAIVVPLVLQALGKKVPLVDSILAGAIAVLQKFRPVKTAPVPPAEAQPGLAAVVDLKPEDRK